MAFEALKEFFYPTPKLSEEETNKIYKEASDFVHSKHRPWMYDDTLANILHLFMRCLRKDGLNYMAITKAIDFTLEWKAVKL